MSTDEFSDPESSYRRGYQQGAYDAVQKVETGASLAAVRNWVEFRIFRWRLEALLELLRGEKPKRKAPPRLPTDDNDN
jgi:hypothetical protein